MVITVCKHMLFIGTHARAHTLTHAYAYAHAHAHTLTHTPQQSQESGRLSGSLKLCGCGCVSSPWKRLTLDQNKPIRHPVKPIRVDMSGTHTHTHTHTQTQTQTHTSLLCERAVSHFWQPYCSITSRPPRESPPASYKAFNLIWSPVCKRVCVRCVCLSFVCVL